MRPNTREAVGKWMYRTSWPAAIAGGIAASALGIEPVQDLPETLAFMAPCMILALGSLALRERD